MSAVNYLIKKLNFFSKTYPGLTIRLEVCSQHAEYLVEISPTDSFQENPLARNMANEIFLTFRSEYPEDIILFITPKNFIKVENAAYEWSHGKEITLKEWTVSVKTETAGKSLYSYFIKGAKPQSGK